MKRRSLLFKIFSVVLAFAVSLILFMLAIWGIFADQSNPFYAHIHLIMTFVILVFAGFLVVSYIIKKLLKPLSVLNEAVERVSLGNLDQQIQIKNNDEIGALAEAFNKMTIQLKRMINSREQLLSDVSHELRTPVTRARLSLEMMPDGLEKFSIIEDLHEMESLITGILESERLKLGKVAASLGRINLSNLLNDLNARYSNEKMRIKIHPVRDDLWIMADKTLLETVLHNVVDNALKFSSQKSSVDINVIDNHKNIRIQIEDYGKGIPEDKLPLVFEPFYRVDVSRSKKTGGYGLGLHLCKRIMDLHGAEILLENKQNSSGLIVSLIFPKE